MRELFRRNNVQGIVIGAVNFGDEQAVAWTVRQARLDVPVLIFGCQEEETLTPKTTRGATPSAGCCRSATCCGRSARSTRSPGGRSASPPTRRSPRTSTGSSRVCRVVDGVRNARYGQIGTRPDAFWTCRYDEKQLQRLGPTTVVLDLSEAIAGANAIADADPDVQQDRRADQGLCRHLGRDAGQPAAERQAGAVPAPLARGQRRRRPGHPVLDVDPGQLRRVQLHDDEPAGRRRRALRLRVRHPGHAVDARLPAGQRQPGGPGRLEQPAQRGRRAGQLLALRRVSRLVRQDAAEAGRAGDHRLQRRGKVRRRGGTVEFVAKPSPLTLCRVTQDADGAWKAVMAEGRFEDNPAVTFGAYGWCRIPNLQRLYRDVLLRHFPHHVAITQTHVGNVLWEAFGNYLGMDVYHATQDTPGLYTPRCAWLAYVMPQQTQSCIGFRDVGDTAPPSGSLPLAR